MPVPRINAGIYRPLAGSNIELALGDATTTLVPATDVPFGLARLPSTSLDSLFEHAGKRLQLIPHARTRIPAWSTYGNKTESAAAKRLEELVDAMPRRRAVIVRPDAAVDSDWIANYLTREWNDLPDEHLTPAIQQAVLVLFGERPVVAVSQSWRLAHKTGLKAPNRVFGAHHLLAYMARHGWGVSPAQAWADAIALVSLIPPVPFFGRPARAEVVDDAIKEAMFDYMAGSNARQF